MELGAKLKNTADQLLAKVQNAKSQLVQIGSGALGSADEFIRKNPVTSTATLAGGALLGGTIVQIARKARKKSGATKTKSKTFTKRKKAKKPKTTSKKKTNKSKSRKKIHHTKTGQPYIILASGKARFISKKSEKLRKKRKGGYY